jgi:hypothetical protein
MDQTTRLLLAGSLTLVMVVGTAYVHTLVSFSTYLALVICLLTTVAAAMILVSRS